MEYRSSRPGATYPNILRLSGEMTHEIPETVRGVIDRNWKVQVSEMQSGLRIMRVIAIVREIISSFIVEVHYIAHPGKTAAARGRSSDRAEDKRQKDGYVLDCRIRAA
eukprot:1427396-Pyramimonas_sp.AAC.1